MNDLEFLEELHQMVLRRAAAMHLVDTMAFVSEVAERLGEDPVFGEFLEAEYQSQGSRNRQLKIHGFTELDESDGTIGLVIGRWTDDSDPRALLTSDIDQMSGWLKAFTSEALTGKLDERITESSPAYQVAATLRSRRKSISRVRLHILSNQSLSQKYRRESLDAIDGIPTETHIWDLQRLKALYGSSREREAIEIELSEFGSKGIPCIKASDADGLQSFLCVIEGELLANLFERYGSRLLEGNVRSFLGMKGGVNKGIRSTIQDSPHLFFAYNNGIAATAAHIEVEAGSLIKLTDLQIVNGGQTTASVLRARKQDQLSLVGVTVPMKLTVVASEQAHDLIPKIAEYANTQNKVAIADFFANHPFHRKLEEISRRLLVPARAGVRVQSKWFYERSRGQYQNERLYLTQAKKDAFDLEYPAKQVINKTELAKYDSSLAEKPYWVSMGAQKNFTKFATQFAPSGEISESEHWINVSPSFGESYYQKIVAMAILWKKGEEIVSAGKAHWYLGDYRPQIVAYTWALIFRAMRSERREPDFGRVWANQGIDDQFATCFRNAAIKAQRALLVLPEGSSNVGEWSKKEACWENMKKIRLAVEGPLYDWSIEREEFKRKVVDGRRQGVQDDGIALQAKVLALSGSGYWSALYDWPRRREFVLGPEERLLSRALTPVTAVRIASDRECRRLMGLKAVCELEGFRYAGELCDG